MSPRLTDELSADLARDLSPVRPVARLRSVGAVALGVWAAVVLLAWSSDGLTPEPGHWSWQHFAGLAGLGLAGLGGLVAALASAIPGRERVSGRSRNAMWVGIVAALVAGGAGAWSAVAQSYEGSLSCTLHSIILGTGPLAVAAIYMARGATPRLRLPSCFVLMGAAGLGAAAVQATCPMLIGGHVLLGHMIGPLALAVLASVPLASVLALGSAGTALTPSWESEREDSRR